MIPSLSFCLHFFASNMHSLRAKTLMSVLGAAIFVEAAFFFVAWLAGPDRTLFKIFLAFHRPAFGAAGLIVPELVEDNQNISMTEDAIVWVVVITVALLQWFLLLLVIALLRQQCFRKKDEQFLWFQRRLL